VTFAVLEIDVTTVMTVASMILGVFDGVLSTAWVEQGRKGTRI
jgi:hypothetical protein